MPYLIFQLCELHRFAALRVSCFAALLTTFTAYELNVPCIFSSVNTNLFVCLHFQHLQNY